MKDIAQLAVFIRGVNEDFSIIVELAELTTMKGKTCTTKFFSTLVTFQQVSIALKEKNLGMLVMGQRNDDAAKLWGHKKRTFYRMTTLDHTVCFFKKYYVQKCKMTHLSCHVQNHRCITLFGFYT